MIIPVGYAQVNYRFGGNALPLGAECTLGVDVGEVAGGPAALAESAYLAWSSTILDYQSGSCSLLEVRAKFGPNETGAFAEYSGPATGSASGDTMPASVAILVEKVTGLGGRAGRGRMFVPGIDEDTIDMGGVIDPANVTGINAALVTFIDAFEGLGYGLVLLHNSALVSPTPITSMSVDPQCATQRRRNRR